MKKILGRLANRLIPFFGGISWERPRFWLTGRRYGLTWKDHMKILEVLAGGNYIILTRRKSHLSTYMTNLAHFLLTGRLGYWSHVAMNIEPDVARVQSAARILESIGGGVRISGFYDVFDCDSVLILKPLTSIPWDAIVARGLANVGKPYDDLFDLNNEDAMSCVETILDALKKDPEYHKNFHGLEAMIKLEKNLTPDMFSECGSFEVVLEIRS